MKTKPMLELADAEKVIAAARAFAESKAWRVTIAVADDGGNLMLLLRMDGAPAMSATVAPGKAQTCATTLRPSKHYEDMVNSGRTAAARLPCLPIEGGEMIVVDGHCIGAVGVSGVKPGEDAEIARAGVAAIGAQISFY